MTDQDCRWHSVDAAEALTHLESRPDGLDEHEATERLSRHGPNRLAESPGRGPVVRLLTQFQNSLVIVLVGAGFATALLGHLADSAVILAVVVVNAVVGFIQEGRAEKAIDAIRVILSPRALVLRGGLQRNLSAESLVPGDICLLYTSPSPRDGATSRMPSSA